MLNSLLRCNHRKQNYLGGRKSFYHPVCHQSSNGRLRSRKPGENAVTNLQVDKLSSLMERFMTRTRSTTEYGILLRSARASQPMWCVHSSRHTGAQGCVTTIIPPRNSQNDVVMDNLLPWRKLNSLCLVRSLPHMPFPPPPLWEVRSLTYSLRLPKAH